MDITSLGNQRSAIELNDKVLTKSEKKVSSDLGKDDFLNLLVTQLRYQDPLNPMDDKSFIAQMAQFSTLEQMQNLNGSMTQIKAFSLVGKSVVASIVDASTKEARQIEGLVTAVKINSGKAFIVVGDEDIPVDSVVEVV